MTNTFRTIDESELEDFETECRSYGLDPNEFQLNEHDYSDVNAKVTITRNNKQKTYNTGHNTCWVYDFIMDLRRGVFN